MLNKIWNVPVYNETCYQKVPVFVKTSYQKVPFCLKHVIRRFQCLSKRVIRKFHSTTKHVTKRFQCLLIHVFRRLHSIWNMLSEDSSNQKVLAYNAACYIRSSHWIMKCVIAIFHCIIKGAIVLESSPFPVQTCSFWASARGFACIVTSSILMSRVGRYCLVSLTGTTSSESNTSRPSITLKPNTQR